jgi:Xaa-Pro aminopeptidase
MDYFKDRWRRVQQIMHRDEVDAILLPPSSDFYYVTGLPTKPSERFTAFILLSEGAPTLILPQFELAGLGPDIRQTVSCRGWEETDDPFLLAARILGKANARVAVGSQMWTTFLLSLQERLVEAHWVSAADVMSTMRMTKDDREIHLLMEAQSLAGDALSALLERGFEGKTERQVAAHLTAIRLEVGLDPVGSAGIIGSGPNGASPHHMNSDRPIKKGDAVLVDFGGGHQGYRADITRTFHVGPATGEFTDVYRCVQAANEAAFSGIRPGVTCESVDRAGREVITAAGYGKYFTHRLGHGIGIDGHEEPYLVQGNKLMLQTNMTVTDEPGIYLPARFGVRIEDVIHVTSKGAERMTHFSRELHELD